MSHRAAARTGSAALDAEDWTLATYNEKQNQFEIVAKSFAEGRLSASESRVITSLINYCVHV